MKSFKNVKIYKKQNTKSPFCVIKNCTIAKDTINGFLAIWEDGEVIKDKQFTKDEYFYEADGRIYI